MEETLALSHSIEQRRYFSVGIAQPAILGSPDLLNAVQARRGHRTSFCARSRLRNWDDAQINNDIHVGYSLTKIPLLSRRYFTARTIKRGLSVRR